MAVRQYIGARYVPLYVGNWDATQNYEPLTIVTDANGNSFTSLKDVPAGTALTNREYWIQTSSFSGAVDQLTRRVNAVEADVETLETSVNNINTRLENIYQMNGRKFILIGDSFGYGISSSSVRNDDVGFLKALKDSAPDTFFYNPVPSSGNIGFTSSRPVLDVVQNITLTAEQKSQITDIVYLGGTNDSGNESIPNIENAIKDFIDYCKTDFPNAKVRIGIIGTYATKKAALVTAYKTCEKYGASYMSAGENLFCNPGYVSDGTHLTEAGYIEYLPYLIDIVVFGDTDYELVVQGGNITFTSGLAVYPVGQTVTFHVAVYKDHCTFMFNEIYKQMTVSNPASIKGGGVVSEELSTLPIVYLDRYVRYRIFGSIEFMNSGGDKIGEGTFVINSENKLQLFSSDSLFGRQWSGISIAALKRIPIGYSE